MGIRYGEEFIITLHGSFQCAIMEIHAADEADSRIDAAEARWTFVC